jgi:predicted nucleic acid-binding protein
MGRRFAYVFNLFSRTVHALYTTQALSTIKTLRGRDEQEWSLLQDYLVGQNYLELSSDGWSDAARIYYDLRRKGLTVRSTIDCCIAQTAIYHQAVLVHNDRDFETIAQVRSLQHLRFLP